jgi:hypothetical protein
LKIHFNIILPCTPGSPKWSPSGRGIVRFNIRSIRNSATEHDCQPGYTYLPSCQTVHISVLFLLFLFHFHGLNSAGIPAASSVQFILLDLTVVTIAKWTM